MDSINFLPSGASRELSGDKRKATEYEDVQPEDDEDEDDLGPEDDFDYEEEYGIDDNFEDDDWD